MNSRTSRTTQIAAIWLLFVMCLTAGAAAFAAVGTEPVVYTSPASPVVDALRVEDLSPGVAPAGVGARDGGTITAVAADDCIDVDIASSETVFGRYYSCSLVPDDLARVSPDASSTPISCNLPSSSNPTADACFWKYAEEPNQLLPAWRWRDHVGLYNNTPGLDGVINTMFSFLASVLFVIAGFAWWVLLEVAAWSLTDTLVQDAAEEMNRGFAMVTDLLNASGIFFVFAAVGLFVLVKLLIRGRLVRVLGMVLAFVLPIAAMQGLAGRAASTGSDSDLPTASPAWIAVSGVNVIDGFTSWFTSGFGRLAIISGSLQVQQAAAVDPSCAPYVAALYDQYYAYSSAPVRQIRTATTRAQQAAVSEFAASQGASDLSATDPLMYQWVYAQVSAGLLEEARENTIPTDQADWESLLAERSTTEKLQDARQYKVATVSQLWQRAFLGSWSAAQFGNQERAARLYCHLLEANADVSPQEQFAVAGVANRYAYTVHQGVAMKAQGYNNMSLGAFERGESKSEREQRLYAWAACYRDPTLTGPDDKGGWKVDPAWAALTSNKITDDVCHTYFEQQASVMESIRNDIAGVTEKGISYLGNDNCGGWGIIVDVVTGGCVKRAWNATVGNIWVIGEYLNTQNIADNVADAVADEIEAQTVDRNGAVKPLEFDGDEAVYAAIASATAMECDSTNGDVCGGRAAQNFTSAKEAGNLVLATKGYNPIQRVALGVLGLFTSLIYVYALGFLALGSFLAKFGLIFLVMLAPVSLLLLALPSSRNERNQTGIKMLRLTAGFIVSHGLLSFVLGLVLSMILLMESLVGGDGGSIINAAIPIAALFIVKKLLQSVGLGNLTSMQGALGMPLAAATMAAGKDWNAATMGKFNKLTGGEKWDPKTGQYKARGMSAADAFAKRAGKRAALAAPLAGLRAGKWAAGKASDRMALPERRAQLLGRRDANGNLTELGLAQRMKSLAGLMDMARDSKMLGRPTERFLNTAAGKKFDSFARSNRFARAAGNADRAKAQMEWRRASIQAITGGTREQRTAARAAYAGQIAEELVASQRALRDPDGNIIRDPQTGQPIFGYRHSTQLHSKLGTPITDHEGRAVYAVEDLDGKRTIPLDMLDKMPGLEVQHRPDGSVVTGQGGRAIYGWAVDDGTGVTVVDYEQYKALSPEMRAAATQLYSGAGLKSGVRYVHDPATGANIIDHNAYMQLSDAQREAALQAGLLVPVTNLNDGQRFFSDEELIEHARRFSEEHALRPGQAVFSAVGFDGIIAPVMADASGRNRLVVTKTEEASEDLARWYRIQYLANHQKSRPAGATDDQYAALLHMMESYLGGYDDSGRKTDVILDELGLSADSAFGREQVVLALAGKASELDKIHYEIPSEVYQSMVQASLAYSPRGEMKAVYDDIATDRTLRLTEAQMQLELEQSTIAETAVHLEASKVTMRAVAPKLRAVQARIAAHDANPVLARQSQERVDLELEIQALEAEVATTLAEIQRVSQSGSSRAGLAALQDALRSQQEAQKHKTDALADLDDTLAQVARQRQEMADEERALSQQVADLARTVADDSAVMFNASKRAEELGAQMEFAFKAFRRDKGKEDWSKVDEAIDDWIKAHNSKWAMESRELRSLEEAFNAATAGGDEVEMRKAYDDLAGVLTRLGRAGARAASDGAMKHGQIVSDLAALEGNMRHIVETNPAVIPWSGRNYER